MRGLLLLYRDFRLEDQTALFCALEENDELGILWIYDEKEEGIPWASRESCHGLRTRLTAFRQFNDLLMTIGHEASLIVGNYKEVLMTLRQQTYPFDAVYFNRFYDRAGRAVEAAAAETGAMVCPHEDVTIFHPSEILKKDGTSYQMFTPYYRQWLDRFLRTTVSSGRQALRPRAKSVALTSESMTLVKGRAIESAHPVLEGGYAAMITQWRTFLEDQLVHYSERRDFPSLQATSGMSVYLNTGMLSPRQFVSDLVRYPGHEPVLRQYVWREFYLQLLRHYPHVLETAMRPEYKSVRWERNPEYFEAWCQGRTGVPIVDAAMRCLKHEGRMHNRLRMVAASYLVKDLHVNWQLGEQYFFEQLADSEPALNNGGWQWSASTGTDAQPYFRVFNPWQQSLRYDAAATFMKLWLPEVGSAPAVLFHKPGGLGRYGYPEVIVDHGAAVRMTKALYQEARQAYLKELNRE
ncbi:MAG: hypothetical protein GT601_15145 [Acidaminobacter sp.]|uniref:cryptochrome/photolyase family protein n=1 Tax=Acidaminobacter sp. TaxID=1872102 RepID=UPI00137CA6F7|nr:deoxyribodipyrimidine photo-lyase [Acidaminobacter sp.]MZQ99002.1 hypothetical protein [Acidaminobacter sp.]